MATLIHNYGLELPIYSRFTRVAWTTEDIKRRADSRADSFVRRILVHNVGATSLKGALHTTDIAMERFTETTGIDVVEHEWALTPRHPSRSARRYDDWRLRNDFVPNGLYLVARVTNIKHPIEQTAEIHRELVSRISKYRHNSSDTWPKLGNLGPHQVVVTAEQTCAPKSFEATLVDIDAMVE